MIPEYNVPRGYGEAEFIEKKSRFIGRVWPVATEKQAVELLNQTRAKHRDASHNVYAYRLKSEGVMRYNDDGEPSGTAGMPLLDVFLRREIFDFLCISTRYFGGTLLGTGGLTRAYSHSAGIALASAGVAVMRLWSDGVIVCQYAMLDRLKRLLQGAGATITDVSFSEHIDIYFSLSASLWESLCAEITEFSSGTMEPVILQTVFRPG